MKLLLFTSNSRRHIFVANDLATAAEECLVVSEVKPSLATDKNNNSSTDQHFKLREETELQFFPDSDFFRTNTLAINKGEINQQPFINVFKKFSPDMVIVYGSSIIGSNLLAHFPKNKSINLHLGLSPYYRGSGTNFWPFVNKELEYVGSTLLHIDAGVDTGDILVHIRPDIEIDDDVHTVGCKVIKASAQALKNIVKKVKHGEKLQRVPQWKVKNEKYYKNKDFSSKSLKKYHLNMKNGLISKYLENQKDNLKLIL